MTDVFSFVIQEVVTGFNTCKTYMGEKMAEMGPDQLSYLDQCVRFLFFSYVFFNEEPKVKAFFDRVRSFAAVQDQSQETVQFESVLNALVFMCGLTQTRKAALRLIYLIVFVPFWLKVKVTKTGTDRGAKRQITFIVPDFSQDSFVQLFPTTLQIVRMPVRDDLILSQEQRSFIVAMEAQPNL